MKKRKKLLGNNPSPLQFGFTLITPLLLFLFFAIWIKSYFQIGYWIFVVGILVGVLSIFYQLWILYDRQEKKNQASQKEKYNYNTHQ